MQKILNQDQKYYFNKIIENINLNEQEGNFDLDIHLITGKAGTGKSFLSTALIDYYLEQDKDIQCTALTHKALEETRKKLKFLNIKPSDLNGFSTIHSYLNIKPMINYKTGLEEFKIDKHKKAPKKCDILFIDEVSMLSRELWEIILGQRFLYKHIILIGDEFQIPSVNDNYNVFQDPNIKKYKLTKIVRQASDNPIINLASEIVQKIENNDFKDPMFCIKKAKEYSSKTDKIIFTNNTETFLKNYYNFVISKDYENYYKSNFSKAIITAYTNKTVDSYNHIAKQIFKKSNNINYIDRGDLLILQEPAFDPYMPDEIILNNNSEFFVRKLEDDIYEGIPIYKAYNKKMFIRIVKPEAIGLFNSKLEDLANKAKLNNKLWKMYYDFKKRFVSVKQAFAVTCHKAQGSTYERSYIDASDLPWENDPNLAFRLFYVAITRASDLVVIKF